MVDRCFYLPPSEERGPFASHKRCDYDYAAERAAAAELTEKKRVVRLIHRAGKLAQYKAAYSLVHPITGERLHPSGSRAVDDGADVEQAPRQLQPSQTHCSPPIFEEEHQRRTRDSPLRFFRSPSSTALLQNTSTFREVTLRTGLVPDALPRRTSLVLGVGTHRGVTKAQLPSLGAVEAFAASKYGMEPLPLGVTALLRTQAEQGAALLERMYSTTVQPQRRPAQSPTASDISSSVPDTHWREVKEEMELRESYALAVSAAERGEVLFGGASLGHSGCWRSSVALDQQQVSSSARVESGAKMTARENKAAALAAVSIGQSATVPHTEGGDVERRSSASSRSNQFAASERPIHDTKALRAYTRTAVTLAESVRGATTMGRSTRGSVYSATNTGPGGHFTAAFTRPRTTRLVQEKRDAIRAVAMLD